MLDSDGYVVSAGDSMPEESIPYVTGLRPSTYRVGKRLLASDSPALAGYLRHQLAVQTQKIKGLRSVESTDAELLRQAEEDVAYYREALEKTGE